MAKATREDVLACYRNILVREPENEEVVSRLVGWDLWALIHRFSHSDEHKANVGRQSAYSIHKFLRPNYLAQSLSLEARASALIYNYAELRRTISPRAFATLLERGLPVIAGLPDFPKFTVVASLFDGPVDEGEISLIASLAGRRVAVVTSTIVEAAEFGLEQGSALLVSRLQGYCGVGEDAKQISKTLGDITMPHLMFATLEGMASALGVKTILSVEGRAQPSFCEKYASKFTADYDDFFQSLGACRMPSGFFTLSLPRREALLAGVRTHRSRSRKRRAVRRAIMEQARKGWEAHMPAIKTNAGRLPTVPVAPHPLTHLRSVFTEILKAARRLL